MDRKDKIAVLIPCYNESKTIKKVVEDAAMRQIMDYLNEQKTLGYTEVKNRCHLYLNLATPKKVAFPGKEDGRCNVDVWKI